MSLEFVEDGIERSAAAACALSDAVWDEPELYFQEERASRLHLAELKRLGFQTWDGVAGLATAVSGAFGSGGPVIAFLGEYDALPNLSQEAGISQERPLVAGGAGHGCGHNLLGAASLLAAAGCKHWLEKTGTPGTVRYYGCPAEEAGSGKSIMVREGVFDDVDVAICWHPAAFTGVNRPASLACAEMEFTFRGRTAHASSAAHLGRSALDAVELMHVGVNYLREHIPSTARIHYAIVDAGGSAPNVVQAHARTRHLVRAKTLADMWDLVERVSDVAKGAALMTGTRVGIEQVGGDANLVGNPVLERVMHDQLERLGGPVFDANDRQFAREIQATLSSKAAIDDSYARFGLEPVDGETLREGIYPLGSGNDVSIGSTDVGTVSWIAPTVQCRVACYAVGTPGHSWQLVAQGKASAAHKGLVFAAKAMAATAADLFENSDKLTRAKAHHRSFRGTNEFRNPMQDVPMVAGSRSTPNS